MSHYVPEKIFEIFVDSLFIPVSIMVYTSSYLSLFFGSSCQFALLWLYYRNTIESKIKMLEVTDIVDSLVEASIVKVIQIILIIAIQKEALQYVVQQHELSVEKKKKDD
mmetsp:Transcript_16969/g.14861  ORF Transcript_16969/g.14861 Transcript_16969/m.14861 type:complete len:109 (-) Transcript_16969:906-1232(-)|eukprot:CAMPEP_0114603242 /NCGR_PEP_ID=MMETSP0125-20121206/25680_1 /TAXON_ID=485358 ORGANISM="Aristerostoma sp., Strain ATCC 50986" /NCGR_SAMPLE_ID=MMETSP0125 /ASSEMBLY_ACC=CAM_ASM_000245 /LENGTH=108 /DNA_ID=CAMNT_0001813913 /DNA_START=303 /DNA_END=629 /DNA_ORIENTATION=+